MAKLAHTIEYVNNVIQETFPFGSLPVWVRRRKFTAHLRTVLFEQLYDDIDDMSSEFFWERFLHPLVGDLSSEEGVKVHKIMKPPKEVADEMKKIRKEYVKVGGLPVALPEFLSTFQSA